MEKIYEQIRSAQAAQIAKPRRVSYITESSLVFNRLVERKCEEAANLYWKFVTGSQKIDDPEIQRLQEQVNALTVRKETPAWWHAGT